MRKLFSILIVMVCLYAGEARSENIPVLLMVNSSEQSDTSGCNFVQELTELIYNEIVVNKVPLWDSRSKEIQLSPSTLKQIEKNAGIHFNQIETIFVYELWESQRSEIATKTLGFSFINKTEQGEVNFGYVDFADVEKALLRNKINTNANGIYHATYTTYVLGKKYGFNIVQFNGQPVKSVTDSDKILKEFKGDKPFNISLLGYYPPDKYITSIIDTYTEGDDVKSVNSRALVTSVENFLTANQEEYFNMGGDKVHSYLQKNKLKVTKIELTELWRKLNDSLIFDTRSMTIFVNDSALESLTPDKFQNLGIIVGETPLTDILASRDFNYIITRINAQTIRRQDAYLYQRALLKSDWTRVIENALGF